MRESDEDGQQEISCERCIVRGLFCCVNIFHGSVCAACKTHKAACSLTPICGDQKQRYLRGYKALRAFRQWVNADIYPKPVILSTKWQHAKSKEVPTWFIKYFHEQTDGRLEISPPNIHPGMTDPPVGPFPRVERRSPVTNLGGDTDRPFPVTSLTVSTRMERQEWCTNDAAG